jgi:hypothetical protein
MPKAVYVRFDGFSLDSGYGPGVVAVEASSGRWKYLTHDVTDGRRMCEVPMHRIQLPLAPERVRTVQTAQGLSMDSASMLLTRPAKIVNNSALMIFRLGCCCFFLAFDAYDFGHSVTKSLGSFVSLCGSM